MDEIQEFNGQEKLDGNQEIKEQEDLNENQAFEVLEDLDENQELEEQVHDLNHLNINQVNICEIIINVLMESLAIPAEKANGIDSTNREASYSKWIAGYWKSAC